MRDAKGLRDMNSTKNYTAIVEWQFEKAIQEMHWKNGAWYDCDGCFEAFGQEHEVDTGESQGEMLALERVWRTVAVIKETWWDPGGLRMYK